MWSLDSDLLNSTEPITKGPQVTLESIIYIVISLIVLHMLVSNILSKYFSIINYRPEHEINTLEYSYFYHLSIIVLILSEVNWNLFDLTIWIASYVGIGFIRKAIHIINIEKQIMLNDYSYNKRVVLMLKSSKTYGGILFILSICYFIFAHLMFSGVPIKLCNLLLFPTLMLAVDSFFLFLSSSAINRDILCYFNQNINQIPSTYKLSLLEKIIGSSIRVWHYYNLIRIFFRTFFQKMGLFDCMWMVSVLNACFISGRALIESIAKWRSFNKLIEKMNRIFRRNPSAPDQMCVICMTELLNCRKLTHCGHLFHYKCLFQWIQTKLECPICRAPINLNA